MSVVVHFVNGTTKKYRDGEAANLHSPLFMVSRWNSKRRKLEDIEVLSANEVTLAEVFDRNGTLKNLIVGEGKRIDEGAGR